MSGHFAEDARVPRCPACSAVLCDDGVCARCRIREREQDLGRLRRRIAWAVIAMAVVWIPLALLARACAP